MNLLIRVIVNNINKLYRYIKLRGKIKKEIEELKVWYQPIKLAPGISTYATDKNGKNIRIFASDRGIKKWNKFIAPGIPFDLRGKRVLEIGCNAGMFPFHVVRKLGAREAVGIEKDNHYYEQAKWLKKTFEKLDDKYLPVRFYQGSMEGFDYKSLGTFDVVFMFAVIYHIGKSDDYKDFSNDEIHKLQVDTLKKVSLITPMIIFQANPLEDEGRGKGIKSLKKLVSDADLSIDKETITNHARGYVLCARSNKFNNIEKINVSRMCNKYYLPVKDSAEHEAALILHNNENVTYKDLESTRYYRLRTGIDNWESDGQGNLPKGLSKKPQYWVMPWSIKRRSLPLDDNRSNVFKIKFNGFLQLYKSIKNKGYDTTSLIPGYKLVHPEKGKVFIYTDGNHRMGILSVLNDDLFEVNIRVLQVIHRECLLELPLLQQLIEEQEISEKDAYRYFDGFFWFIK